MFCIHCGKEIREGSKFCINCGAAVNGSAVKIEPNTIVTETPVAMENPNDKALPVIQKGGNKLPVGLIVLIIVIICGAFWFLGGRDLLLDAVGTFDSKKTTDDSNKLHISDEEETEEEIEFIEEIEDSENALETEEMEVVEDQAIEITAEEEAMNSDEYIEEEEETEEPSEYILENSDTRYLTKEDLIGMTAEECRLARNELYARHGRKFDDEGLQSYFEACSWYQGLIEASDFQESMLSDIEIANRDLIVEYEKEMGYR